METYIQQLSTFTADDKWCHLLSSLGIRASDIQQNSQKCICPNVPRVPMCPRLPYGMTVPTNYYCKLQDTICI